MTNLTNISTEDLVEKLKHYNFIDSKGHPLLNCVEFLELVERADDSVPEEMPALGQEDFVYKVGDTFVNTEDCMSITITGFNKAYVLYELKEEGNPVVLPRRNKYAIFLGSQLNGFKKI